MGKKLAIRTPVTKRDAQITKGDEANIAPNAVLGGGAVIGRRSRVEAGAHVDGSIVGDDAVIGAGASLKNCFVAAGFEVPAHVIAVDNYFGF